MTHAPPVPADNQSPYPIAEPPHARAPAAKPDDSGTSGGAPADRPHTLPPAIGPIGILAAVLAAGSVAGLLYAFGRNGTPKRNRPAANRRRKTS